MTKQRKIIAIILLILNAIVLLGQIWPEGVPPFAKTVNIITLSFNLIFFLSLFRSPGTHS